EADGALDLVCVTLGHKPRRLWLAARDAVELEAELVPVDAEPRERALGLLRSAFDLAVHVRVLDPEQAFSALLAREQPVEEKRARGADVEKSGRARCHSDSYGHRGCLS